MRNEKKIPGLDETLIENSKDNLFIKNPISIPVPVPVPQSNQLLGTNIYNPSYYPNYQYNPNIPRQ